MSESVNSKVENKAKVWLTPKQVEELRNACYSTGAPYLQQRNESIVVLMYDTGLRVGELVQTDVDMLRDGNTKLYLPSRIQKDYPNDNTPDPVTMSLSADTTRTITPYLNSRWKDTQAIFPSRSSPRITEQGVRNMVHKVAEEAGIRPYKIDGSRGGSEDVTPHALRHSVAYRMMNHEDGNELYDVRNRLRHRTIQTTERVYDHMIEV
jgi:integrase/recombinase XerC/integrase/recombinase XerD